MNLRFLFRAFKARYRDQAREIGAAVSFLRPGQLAVDIGAHKGAYVFWLRRAVGHRGKVLAYEPQPSLAGYLRSMCAAMGWDNVVVQQCALSDGTGTRTLYVPGSGPSPGASLGAAGLERDACHSHLCTVDTLDRQLHGEQGPAFLKVDVEGHELQVFRGADETIARHAPPILFECEQRHLGGSSMDEVFQFLEERGYAGSFFSPAGLRPLDEFDPARHQRQDSERFWDAPGYCNNFLFQPSEPTLRKQREVRGPDFRGQT